MTRFHVSDVAATENDPGDEVRTVVIVVELAEPGLGEDRGVKVRTVVVVAADLDGTGRLRYHFRCCC